ncbi:hypothetical protein BK133_14485 [Paenibacillus sp. FSL H8-0548]|uniref:DUF4367 domain-containing protein n=1 Tax=Paenibacillus sp. FSL H8-0548 TaxID=1920422 RepID=UPI00096DFC5A|nr:DUF4367 domain-containing protein [Paenibacillus sp. FSL H8-0548]OMF32228.1 hypothetical protein BK133_14485 [Paenibacillus sp. FSL H8-0548]
MTDMERNLRQHLQKESDDMLFSKMELSDSVKQKIRKQATAEQRSRRRFVLPKAWLAGAAALVAAVVIVTGLPMLQEPAEVPIPTDNSSGTVLPGNGGSTGSELSQLITTPFGTAEAAKTAFGSGVHVPQVAPEGFKLAEIVGVGMKDQPLRDLNFTYGSGDKTVTFSASRMPAAFPMDLFTQTKVGGADGFIFEQAEFTELFWVVDGIQYGVSGPISGDEAMKVAESVEP